MSVLSELFQNNVDWSVRVTEQDPHFFERLSEQQAPNYLWIGCADSRVPANEIVGLYPGELFVHRNVANLVVHTDLNCLSVIQYAVDVLNVEHIIVCGHHGCGGVAGALAGSELGLIENWLRHIQDVASLHAERIEAIEDTERRNDRLCDLNVIEQVVNVCRTTIVRDAWRRGGSLAVHGWVYSLKDGRLRDLDVTVSNPSELEAKYAHALASSDPKVLASSAIDSTANTG